MATNHFRRFSDIAFLRRLDFELLLTFLRQFEKYLTHERSLKFDENLLTFQYQHLAEILLTPDSDMPMELVEGLYFVHELAQKTSEETLYRHLEKAGIFPPEHLPVEDLLLLTLIEKPEILDYLHAEQYLVRPKKFETLFCRSDCSPTITDDTMRLVETELNEWFSTQRKGRGVRIFHFVRPDGLWFLVQHGKQLKCDFTHEDNGDSRRIVYRPGTFDVLCFLQDRGEFRIHTATKKEREQYGRLFGRHFFGNDAFFQKGDDQKKYLLDPLKTLSKHTLACSDISGIKSVELLEIHVTHDERDNLRETYRTETNLLEHLEILAGRLTGDITIVRATFRLTFDGDSKARCVTVCAPNVTIYDREVDGLLVDRWLKSKGFLIA
ncbi:MAG: hypothetical protein FWC43_08045 [Planctomycetaceae bacterium]|nr:hypothetical protein [Planctomycetaceae bacterium]